MIASGFRGNPPIEVLNLSHNRITVMGARLLASGLESSTHLKVLGLACNELDGRAVGALEELLRLNGSILNVDTITLDVRASLVSSFTPLHHTGQPGYKIIILMMGGMIHLARSA